MTFDSGCLGLLFYILWFLGMLLLRMRLRAWLLLNLLLLDLLNLLLRLDTLRGGLCLPLLLTFLAFLSLNRHCVLRNILRCNLALWSCLWIHIDIAWLRTAILACALLLATIDNARLGTLLHISGLRLLLLLHRLRHLIHNGWALC